MADASSPDVNSGGKKNFSRRDFLKVAGLGLGALAVKPKLVEIGDSLEKEAVLMSARQFLIKNECIPPEVENVPNENKEFKFADDVLQNAIDLYERWAAENKLPDPYYHKSEVYLSRKDVAIDASRAYSDFFDFLNHVFKDKEGFRYYTSTPGGYLALFGGYFEGSLRDYVSSKVEKFGSKPFFFSREDLELGAYDVIFKNPGSPLIARVAQSVGAVNDNTVPDTQNEQGKMADVRQRIDFEVNVRAENEITKILTMLDTFNERLGIIKTDEELDKMKEKMDIAEIKKDIEQGIKTEDAGQSHESK